jgi:hypothetical protein
VDAFIVFLSPDLKIPAKKLGASKFRGQQGDKDEKVKIVKVFIYNKLLNSNISWIAKEKFDKWTALRRYAMKAQEEE